MKKNRPITQKQVAERLGLSRQAVSFALSGGGSLADATREHIRREAERMGYRPNAAAQAMVRGRFGAVAVFSDNFHRSYLPTSILTGVEEGLDHLGIRMVLASVPAGRLADQRQFRILNELSVDGLLVMDNNGSRETLENALRRQRVPHVWLNRLGEFDCVYPAERMLARRATGHLLDLGHKRIAYVEESGPDEREHFSRTRRRLGYEQMMGEAGLPQINVGPGKGASLRVRLAQAIKRTAAKRPTAFLCQGRKEAELAYLIATAAGMEVPRDLSLITIAPPVPFFADVALSHVRQPFYWVGRRAVDLLMQKLADNGAVKPALSIDTDDPIEGATTAPPPAR